MLRWGAFVNDNEKLDRLSGAVSANQRWSQHNFVASAKGADNVLQDLLMTGGAPDNKVLLTEEDVNFLSLRGGLYDTPEKRQRLSAANIKRLQELHRFETLYPGRLRELLRKEDVDAVPEGSEVRQIGEAVLAANEAAQERRFQLDFAYDLSVRPVKMRLWQLAPHRVFDF